MLKTIVRSFFVVACLLSIVRCGGGGGTNSAAGGSGTPETKPPAREKFTESPKEIVGYWTDAETSFDLNRSLLRVHADGKIERVLPVEIKNRPSVIGHFGELLSSDGKNFKLSFVVAPNATYPEVISVPFEFRSLDVDRAEFIFTTDFFKVKATKPAGPIPGGFWGPGSGIGLPLSASANEAINSELKFTMKRVSESDLAKYGREYQAAKKLSDDLGAKWEKRKDLVKKTQSTYLNNLTGGYWVLQRAELFDRKTGILVTREERSNTWEGKTPIFEFYRAADSLAHFQIIKRTDPTVSGAFSHTFVSPEGRNMSLYSELIYGRCRNYFHQEYGSFPLEMGKDLLVIGVINLIRDYQDYVLLLHYRRQQVKTESLPAPQIFNYDKKLFESDVAKAQNHFSKLVEGTWHLQSYQMLRGGADHGIVLSDTPYDPASKGVTGNRKKALPFKLVFQGMTVAPNDGPSIKFRVGNHEGYHFISADDRDNIVESLDLLGRSEKNLQLGIGYTNNEVLVLNYGKEAPKSPSTEMTSRAKLLGKLIGSRWSFGKEKEELVNKFKTEFSALMVRWAKTPDKVIQLPIWISGILYFSEAEASQVTFDMMKSRAADLDFLDELQILELNHRIDEKLTSSK
jgi:hypothetical protein